MGVPLLHEGILKGGLGKALDGLLGVVHAHAHPCPVELVHLPLLLLASAAGGEHQLQLARLCHMQVCSPILITKGMPGTQLKGQRGAGREGCSKQGNEGSTGFDMQSYTLVLNCHRRACSAFENQKMVQI